MSTTTSTGRQYTEREEEIIAKWADDLLSGLVFRRHAAGARSIIGYQPPSRSDNYGRAIAILGSAASRSDRQAKLLSPAIRALPLHHTDGETVGKMFDAVAAAVGDGFFDTIGAASPEPGRRSDNEHAYTLRDVLHAYNALIEAAREFDRGAGCGWVAAALMERNGVKWSPRGS